MQCIGNRRSDMEKVMSVAIAARVKFYRWGKSFAFNIQCFVKNVLSVMISFSHKELKIRTSIELSVENFTKALKLLHKPGSHGLRPLVSLGIVNLLNLLFFA